MRELLSLSVSSTKINHSRYALVIWSSYLLNNWPPNSELLNNNFLLELIYFLSKFCLCCIILPAYHFLQYYLLLIKKYCYSTNQKSSIESPTNPDDVLGTWELCLLKHFENKNVDILQNSGMILLTVCQSLQIINHAKSHQHSYVALAISNGFK